MNAPTTASSLKKLTILLLDDSNPNILLPIKNCKNIKKMIKNINTQNLKIFS